MENETALRQKNQIYVGLEANLRKFAVLLFAGWCAHPGCFNVRKSLVLADDLLCGRSWLPRRRIGSAVETS